MKRIAVFLLLVVAACNGNWFAKVDKPAERWAVAAASYTTAVQALTALADTGVLKPDDAQKAELGRKLARTALDTAEVMLVDPNQVDNVGFYLTKATEGIAVIWSVVEEYRS